MLFGQIIALHGENQTEHAHHRPGKSRGSLYAKRPGICTSHSALKRKKKGLASKASVSSDESLFQWGAPVAEQSTVNANRVI